ncbi:hypothetical protein BSL78_16159 [Apostichopus japonicus]|uniref:Transmembrane protein n=1 Tax=Stichopus japonicus TaxID=307972 RepID=A0A2G8KG76_STIJA|nr:hypothetical protein BSL78_16159 [Apostichopus japonicus]
MDDIGKIRSSGLIKKRSKKSWPVMFWILMRALALFYHRSVVTERKCLSCHVGKMTSARHAAKRMHGMDTPLDFYILAYESSSSAAESGSDEMNHFMQEQDGESCDVCQTLWWTCYRDPVKYTEGDLGMSRWIRRWDGVISMGWLIVTIAIFLFYGGSFVPQLFGKPDQILRLLVKLCMLVLLSTHYIFVLCSKIRSLFKAATPRLCWATTLNVRYLIKRAQFLDMPSRGLPGAPFLLICVGCPLLIALYRLVIFLCISTCDVSVYSVSQSLVAAIFMVNWGLFLYLIYFVRHSFQCQFNLLLSYIKEFGDDLQRFRAMILNAAADFSCYQQLCTLYLALTFPVLVIAVVATLTVDYAFNVSNCLDKQSQLIENHLTICAWSEIGVALLLCTIAMGGLKVRYIWENFVGNVLIMKSGKSKLLRKELFQDAEYLLRESSLLLTSILFSVSGLYVGFKFGEQNITFSTCNGTSVEDTCY